VKSKCHDSPNPLAHLGAFPGAPSVIMLKVQPYLNTSGKESAMPSRMNFLTWKARLQDDCTKNGKMLAFNSLGDLTLKVLWESNLDPTVESIGNGNRHAFEVEQVVEQERKAS
jgi:hypothetical protein